MPEEKPGVQILGQRFAWPESWQGMLTALSGLMAIVFIVAIVMIWSRQERIEQLTGLVIGVYDSKGDRIRKEDDAVSVFRFWTPSMHTKYDISNSARNNPEKIDKKTIPSWYWASDIQEGEILEPEVKKFLDDLRLLLPVGINITSVFGVGTSDTKRGYVWEMTVSKRNPISRNQLLSKYKEHWKRERDIWIQEQRAQSTRSE